MAEQKENELDEAAAISSYLRRTRLFLEIKKDLRVGISVLTILIMFYSKTSLGEYRDLY